ncbi:AAA family ATPase [Tomitella biformata]|uniref:AAA family ATPase n=1 Tax=Tomitella biformata TaxID=630403 RepID=UPI0004669EB6|nr:AAA family ATPase [Tomitella biformata]
MSYGSYGPETDLDALLDEARERDQITEDSILPERKNSPTEPRRAVTLSAFSQERDDVPVWAWNYGEKGRVPVGALALFAGRPGAGKSTAGRWFAASASTGTLAGCWEGRPVGVAYIAAEESAKYVVKPGLRAAGADLDKVYMPRVNLDGEEVRFLSSHDMEELTEQLLAANVKLVVVDPLMSTIGSKTDVNRNNEVRSLIEPWSKLAEKIDGVVLGIAHLNKSGNGDVVAGINGSSAFGEVARAVFGFAKDTEGDEGDRILSQEKNSIGEEDLALTYRIESHTVTTDSGKSADVGRFVIIGESDRTVGDVLRSQAAGPARESGAHDALDAWLLDLLADGPVLAKEVYSSAGDAGYSADKARRAKERINKEEEIIEAYRPEIPGVWWWRRTDAKAATSQPTLPTPVEPAALQSSATLQVSGGGQGSEEAQGGKAATSQGVANPAASLPCPTCSKPLGTTGKCVACIVGKANEEAVA